MRNGLIAPVASLTVPRAKKDHQVTFQGTPYLGLILLGEPGYFFEEGDQFCGYRSLICLENYLVCGHT
ncbi:hypothetical protein [Pseudomonas aeruginosa]|uniref:hypothetical protein n=1 Tax=Pseudomonas aeruginosa TaxID=287 RepID=UPI0003D3FAD7|nr:hypothetical protein X922_17685 [Pseudomonas aeruginosa VRFPA08]